MLPLPRRTLLGTGLAALAAPRLAHAAWPERPITLIVPFGAGAGTDLTGRTVAQFLSRELGQPVVVQNRPGAGGAIGYAAVAEAPPDGYTICTTNTPGMVIIPIERGAQARFTLDSLTPLAGIVEDPAIIAVRPDSGIRDVQDLLARARREPRGITASIQGVGGSAWVSMKMLEQATGVQFEHVIYSSGVAAVLAAIQRQVVVGTANLGESLVMAAGQPWQVLGVMSKERVALAPEVPTLREQGVDVIATTVRGISGPRGLPAEILARYGAAFDKITQDPEFQATCRRTFQPLNYMNAAQFSAHVRAEDRFFRDMWARTPWTG
jgi:tripartite-type tricarboxylate transporter receptor subunit TctC